MRRVFALTVLLGIMVGSMLAMGARHKGVRTVHGAVDGVPVTIYTASASPAGAVLIVYKEGLGRPLLRYWGQSLALQGFDVYIPDLPGYGTNRVPAGQDRVLRGLVTSLAHERVAVVGHGTGAGLAQQIAGDKRVRSVVLLSPASLEEAEVPNLLALSAGGDGDAVREAVARVAGGTERLGLLEGDFGTGSARQGALLDGRLLLFEPEAVALAAAWVHASFETRAPGAPEGRYTSPVASPGLEWLVLSLAAAAGLVFTCIAILSPRAEFAAVGSGGRGALRLSMFAGLLLLALAALAAVLMSVWVRPFGWLKLAGGDYLLGFFLLMAVVLFGLRVLWPEDYDFFGGPWSDLGPEGFARGFLLAGITLATFAPVVHTHLIWFTPSAHRLLPLAVLAVGFWLFFIQEEAIKRAVAADLGHVASFAVALLIKVIFLWMWAGAFLLPNPPAVILADSLLLLAAVMTLCESLAFALDRSGYSASVGAVLKAVILAWTVAVTFPTM